MKKIKQIVLALVAAVTLFGCKGQISEKTVENDFEFTNIERKQELAQLALLGAYKVSEETAADSLLSFLISKDSENGRAASISDYRLEKIDTATIDCSGTSKSINRSSSVEEYDDVDFYLYQISNSVTDKSGYAVLSNDRRIGEIISIVDDAEFSGDISDNPYMQFFCTSLEGYVEDTARIWNSLSDADLNAARASDTDIVLSGNYSFEPYEYDEENSNIYHMMSTKWGQNAPYNNVIVAVTKNNYIVGCGAVGIAQVMAYHEYPRYCTSDVTSVIKKNWTKAKDWDGLYDWYSMKCYNQIDSLSERGKTMLGSLMYQVATGIKSSFGTSTTSSNDSNYIPFLNSVGYKSTGKQSYSYDSIKDSVDKNCPVLAMGYARKHMTQKKFLWWKWNSPSYSSGHVWVIDAYCTLKTKVINNSTGKVEQNCEKNYVHCNFGWNGYDNGFYINNVFAANMGPAVDTSEVENLARSTEYNNYYQYVLEIIPNIQPNK